MITAARNIKGYGMLEPDVMKVASPVLRRGRASDRSSLFDDAFSLVNQDILRDVEINEVKKMLSFNPCSSVYPLNYLFNLFL